MSQPTSHSMPEMRSFDPVGPLPVGTTLIEASAGTGKTWALAALVTRYVAEEGLPLDQLLVVTFSRMASQELRERVRTQLEETLHALSRPADPEDDVLLRHLRDTDDTELGRRIERLRIALADFDTGTIATIHQFCHYVLAGLGVAGDSDPQARLAEDLEDLQRDVIDDAYVAYGVDSAGTPGPYDVAVRAARAALANPVAPLMPDPPPAAQRRLFDFIGRVRVDFDHRKRRAALLSYDDLLTQLAQALHRPGSVARERMRARWSVVLVDEFQDTDPVQWDVFATAFADNAKTLVLVGDPKQAIYGFRGGDVHTYLQAAADADTQLSLPVNWRSDGALVDALQQLTGNVELSPGIVVHPITAARQDRRLAGAPDDGPVRLRAFIGDRVSINIARSRVAADVAEDIARLLTSGATFDEEPVSARHVAVLAHTYRELELVRDQLRLRRIPCVLVSSASVLHTEAAGWWLTLLMALEQPHRSDRVRAAALTPFLGWTAEQLDQAGDDATDRIAETLRDLSADHRRGGVAAVLDRLRADGLSARLLASLGGERNITDLEHCAGLLQAKVAEGMSGITGLVTWLQRQSADDATRTPAGARIVRLDSDAHAVTLSTIHGSKGLQYPVVYAPFLFDRWISDRDHPVLVHRDEQRVLAFDNGATTQGSHADEARAEDLRLTYVAITRAQSQLVLWWDHTWNNSNGGLHRLLFAQGGSATAIEARAAMAPGARPIVQPGGDRKISDAGVIRGILQSWESAGAFSFTEITTTEAVTKVAEPVNDRPCVARKFTAAIDPLWRRTSYSSLATAGEVDAATEPETVDLGTHDEEEVTVSQGTGNVGHDRPSPMATLPMGATFGSLVHAVLEEADLQAADLRVEFEGKTRELLRRWPVELDPTELANALELVCETPFGPLAEDLCLRDLTESDRFAEMDFELPLGGGDRPHPNAKLGDIASLLRRHLPDGDPLLPYADALDNPALGDQELRGYLTGSVDLTFRHGGRFFVVDYKTNRLGEPETDLTLADYTPDRLAAAMNHSSYPLQALLYAVVLHRYLRWRLPAYDPESHLGGVLYLYLRGMAGADTPRVDEVPCGVFAWRPPVALVEAVSALLDGAREEVR
ncbi:UvrD-helicase domain-containing protein [Calidifontibacter terrae]